MLFSQLCEYVDGYGVPKCYLLVLWAPFLVEWSGSGAKLAQRRILRVVAWCREPVRMSSLSSGSLAARKARGQRQRDRRLQGRSARRVEGHIVHVQVFDMVKWQERVREPTAEHALVSVVKLVGVGEVGPPGFAEYSATTAAEAVASTVVESVVDCEACFSGLEVPFFVCQDRVQERTFQQFADIPEVVERSFVVVFFPEQGPLSSIETPVDTFMSQTSECVEVAKAVQLERVSKRSCEQGWIVEVSKISIQNVSRCSCAADDRTALMNVPKIVLQDRVQRWNAEQIADFPALPDMWERKIVEAVKIVLQEHIPESPATDCPADRGHSSLAGCGGACLRCMLAWRWQRGLSRRVTCVGVARAGD